ncbi:SpoIIE family protein phosphatase [Eubacteriaceae bacterium ES2]|nr:SpoIIE family protein phosphatase [Eubacteriaceae bacterium ES2]
MTIVNYASGLWPLMGSIEECGDYPLIIECQQGVFVAMIDVLGHGFEARKIAVMASEYLLNHLQNDLLDLLHGLHDYIQGERGLVILLGWCNPTEQTFIYSGIGNIVGRIFGFHDKRLILRDGIIGSGMIHPVIKECSFTTRDLMLIHTDGIKEHFNQFEYPELLAKDPQAVASGLIDQLRKETDDAGCIVFRYEDF